MEDAAEAADEAVVAGVAGWGDPGLPDQVGTACAQVVVSVGLTSPVCLAIKKSAPSAAR